MRKAGLFPLQNISGFPTHSWRTTFFHPLICQYIAHLPVIMGRALILGPLILLTILAQPIMIPAQPINTRAEMLRFEARDIPYAPMPPKPQPKPQPQLP
jgi:hypothetical protein